ncbi:ATP-binding protein [Streptomyces sp. NBC_01497]|uniref:ATP-binding protein n=1 Tax=Streptomyces sp. NBC_01497 TaxID=2903885 RepID=UPI002E3660B4|nr:ATP-binding protein [Streptomyces sp. NBC_01497]
MVEDFVALGIPENLTIEYKRGGEKPVDAVAALANTYGGIVLIGVAEDSGTRGVPTSVVGVSRKEKEKLVNQMATGYDPPWTPEVIEVPLRDGEKMVLIVRIDRDLVPAPLVTDGSIWVRLDGRNVKANRQMMAALLAQANIDQSRGLMRRQATRSPGSYRPAVPPGSELECPDLQLRVITSVPLPPGRRRHRLPTGMPDELVYALQRNGVDHTTRDLMGIGHTVREPWMIHRASSREVEVRVNAAGLHSFAFGRAVVTITEADSLEVFVDQVLFLRGFLLPWGRLQSALMNLVRTVADVLLPEAFDAVVGPTSMAPPNVEIHLSTDRYEEQPKEIDTLIDVSVLGNRGDGSRPMFGAAEVLDEGLIDNGTWRPAVIEALTVIAMDWGFPSPTLG